MSISSDFLLDPIGVMLKTAASPVLVATNVAIRYSHGLDNCGTAFIKIFYMVSQNATL